jgi:DNA-binding XRE family transcriptional regulator
MTADDDYRFDTVDQTGFEASNDVLQMLESIPGINDDLPARQDARRQAEREYQLGLASIRNAMSLTQAEVAEQMGVTQASVSRTEARPDILLSTLRHYFDALGVTATLTIKVGDSQIATDLDHLLGTR